MPYDNLNRGSLFKNENRTEENNQPHAKGSLEVDCPHCKEVSQFWMSAWTKVAGPGAQNPGMKFQSIVIQEKENQTGRTVPASRSADDTRPQPDDFDDDIPF